MRTSNIILKPTYKELKIQTDKSQGLRCRKDMLDTLFALFRVTAFHHRTFFMRFDVRFPADKTYPADNHIFKAFIANLIKYLSRHQLTPHYMWARERANKERNQHYHCILLLNGHKTQSIYSHLKKAEELWGRALDISSKQAKGLIDYCNRGHNGIMIEKDDKRCIDYCYYWASYLAKITSKENLPGIRDWGTTRISLPTDNIQEQIMDTTPTSTIENTTETINIPRKETMKVSNDLRKLIRTSYPQFTEEQYTALELMLAGNNVFLAGIAGTGKSDVIRAYQELNTKQTLYLAPTGMAAQDISGVTIHSCFRFLPGILNIETLVTAAMQNSQPLRNAEVILVDEISMVRAEIFTAMDQVMRQCGDPLLPFGGKQIIVCGDFMQLPPVVSKVWHHLHLDRSFSGIYAFCSTAWQQVNFHTASLTRNFRQQDHKFQQILHNIRYRVYPELNDVINQLNINNYVADISNLIHDDTMFLCCTQLDARIINQLYKESYPNAQSIVSPGITEGIFNDELPVDHITQLFVGQRVMFVKNEYHNGEPIYTNGETGIITEVDPINGNYVVVRTDDGLDKTVYKSTWNNYRYITGQDEHGNPTLNKDIIGTYTQFPLISAKAITIHRAQGKSLDKVCIVPGEQGIHSAWQFYVALSRCRTLENVSISRMISCMDMQTDEQVIKFYQQLR